MSGIAGIFHFDGRPVETGQIEGMTARMAHRGPDGISHWMSGSVALGHCMFHTTAESRLAPLPLIDNTGDVVVVLDGRINNHEDLTRLLKQHGIRPRSAADAELVLQSYLLFGEDLAPRLEGDFAIAIWDGRARKVVCLRDIFAHKPFNYSWNGKTLSLATEVAPVLELPWVPENLDEATVAEFLATQWYSRDATFWQGIHKLPAAHVLVCDKDGPRKRRYWQPDPWRECPARDEAEVAEYYRELLTESVRRNSRSHLPIVCEASGGLDSSAVFALAQELARNGELLSPGLSAYTFRIDEFPESNDLPFARSLGRFLDTDIREMHLTPVDPAGYAERARRRRTFPGSSHLFGHLGIMRDAKSHGSRVLLSGDGGDEWQWMAEGIDYADMVATGDWRGLRGAMAADIKAAGTLRTSFLLARYGLGSNLPISLKAVKRRLQGATPWKVEDTASWLTPHMQELLEHRRKGAASNQRDTARRTQTVFDRRLSNPGRAWAFENSDYETAELQFERRTPFDDRRIVELAYAMPAQMFRRGALGKWLHRKAMAGHLPMDILDRENKAWFVSPYREKTMEIAGILGRDEAGIDRGWVKKSEAVDCFESNLTDWDTLLNVCERLWCLYGAAQIR